IKANYKYSIRVLAILPIIMLKL
ncbi:TPA: hypothetical protein ACPFQ1_000952, partial [Staphylococcus aureus]